MCGTRKSTPRSTAGSQQEVSLLAPPAPPPAAPPGATGLQLNHGLLTVREQSSRPQAGGCEGTSWPNSHSAPGTVEASMCKGPGGTGATSLGCHSPLRAGSAG